MSSTFIDNMLESIEKNQSKLKQHLRESCFNVGLKTLQQKIYQSSFALIGGGTYGRVYKMMVPPDYNFAVKIVAHSDSVLQYSAIKECKIVQHLMNNNNNKSDNFIIQLYAYHIHQNFTIIVMELGDHDLKTWILYYSINKNNNHHLLSYILKLLRSMWQGIAYLHLLKILHLDLKPENLIVKDDCLKITDFGLSIIDKNPEQPKLTCNVVTE